MTVLDLPPIASAARSAVGAVGAGLLPWRQWREQRRLPCGRNRLCFPMLIPLGSASAPEAPRRHAALRRRPGRRRDLSRHGPRIADARPPAAPASRRIRAECPGVRFPFDGIPAAFRPATVIPGEKAGCTCQAVRLRRFARSFAARAATAPMTGRPARRGTPEGLDRHAHRQTGIIAGQRSSQPAWNSSNLVAGAWDVSARQIACKSGMTFLRSLQKGEGEPVMETRCFSTLPTVLTRWSHG